MQFLGRLARKWSRRARLRRIREFEEDGRALGMDEVAGCLGALQVTGSNLFVHSSSEILRHVDGGLGALLGLLRSIVGDRGRLLMPTFPCRGSNWAWAQRQSFVDIRKTPSQMGLLTELFRRSAGTYRSLHPTHPVAVAGDGAAEWASGHESHPMPFHRSSPFGRLHRDGGTILFVGLSGAHLTQVHVAEALLGADFPEPVYIRVPHEFLVLDQSGRERRIPVLLHDPRVTAKADPRVFFDELESAGILRRRMLRGYLPFVAIEATPLVDFLVRKARQSITVYSRAPLSRRLRALYVSRTLKDAPRATLLSRES